MKNIEELPIGIKDVKDLLLADHLYFAESLRKNEESGEARVNFFVTLIAVIPTVIVGFSEKEGIHVLENEVVRSMLLIALPSILIFGLFIFLRLVKRNRITDEFKFTLDTIRQRYKDIYDPFSLLNYRTSPHDENPMVVPQTDNADSNRIERFPRLVKLIRVLLARLANSTNKYLTLGRNPNENDFRGRGSLAHLVALLNSVIVASILFLIFDKRSSSAFAIAGGAFVLVFLLQERYLRSTEITTKENIKSRRFTHAGGIVFKRKGAAAAGEFEYLVMTNKPAMQTEESKKSFFPKGHIEKSEEASEAALREVYEETGVVGRIIRPIGSYVDCDDGIRHKVMLYLMECLDENDSPEYRSTGWLDFQSAFETLSFPESKNMLLVSHSFLLSSCVLERTG